MRICLVAPAWKVFNSYPPLGLAYLAGALEQGGYEVSILDFNLPPHLSPDAQVETIAKFKPDLVGITSMSHVYFGARELAQRIKEELGCTVVFGGPHPSIFKENLLEDHQIDYVVYGEGEETLLELVKSLEAGLPVDGISGLCWRREGQAIRNPPRPAVDNLDRLPFPARHLLRLRDYPLRAPDGTPMATLVTSRGCPYDCSFCYKGLFGRTYRQRSVANVIQELKEVMQNYQIRNFYFIDDLFTLNQRWLNNFTQTIIDEGLDIRWKCLARVDRVNPQILQQMWQAGCREVHYGIESGDEEILQTISKKISLSQVGQAVTWARRAGMMVKGYFMLGLPGDTEESMEKTMKLAAELDLDEAMFSLTTVFPGTRLWQDLAAKKPEVVKEDLSRAYYYDLNGHEILPFMNISKVSDEKLAKLSHQAAESFRNRQEKVWYCDRFGDGWGELLWSISRMRGAKRLARTLNKFGLLPPLPSEQQYMVRRWV